MTLFFTILLALCFFSEGVTAGICFCGQCYPNVVQDITEIKVNSGFHNDSFGGINKKCKLNKGGNFKAIHFPKQKLDTKIFRSLINSGFHDFFSFGISDRNVFPEAVISFLNLPVYLQTLSFRC